MYSYFNTTTFFHRFFVLGLVLSTGFALGNSSEERLTLGDPTQERRTTSINWPDSSVPRVSETIRVDETRPAFRVMFDVGHGGNDLGAPGLHQTIEKEICLKIARYARQRLVRLARLADFPLQVRLSREKDRFIPLRQRARQANEWKADLFVSVHANSSPAPSARGFEVYFLSNEASDAHASRVANQENHDSGSSDLPKGVLSILNDVQVNNHIVESGHFAEAVYASLAERFRPNGRGVRQAPFAVLSRTEMPSLLVEVGYLTHPEEASSLSRSAYQHRLATSLAQGVLRFARKVQALKRRFARQENKRTT